MKLTRERLRQIIKEELQEITSFNEADTFSGDQISKEQLENKLKDFYINSGRYRFTDLKVLDTKHVKHHKAYKMDEPTAWLKWPEHDEYVATIQFTIDGKEQVKKQQVFSDDKGNVSLGQSM